MSHSNQKIFVWQKQFEQFSSPANIQLKDVLHHRLSPPTVQVEDELKKIVTIANVYLRQDPRNRTTMHMISQVLLRSTLQINSQPSYNERGPKSKGYNVFCAQRYIPVDTIPLCKRLSSISPPFFQTRMNGTVLHSTFKFIFRKKEIERIYYLAFGSTKLLLSECIQIPGLICLVFSKGRTWRTMHHILVKTTYKLQESVYMLKIIKKRLRLCITFYENNFKI